LREHVSDFMTFPIAFWASKEKQCCALRAQTKSPTSQENRNLRWGKSLPVWTLRSDGRPACL
jgi:hypothetical protein